MPAPKPLTATPSLKLDWSRPEAPAATDFDDIYFSVDGGLAETETVFLKGCGLPENWAGRRNFVIGELGFGTGLNFLALWRLWDSQKAEKGRLHFISIEKFPLDREQLSRALKAWPELAKWAQPLLAAWPDRVRGFHRLDFKDIILTLIHDDVETGLSQMRADVNAWFLDGFSPAKNPDMWSSEIMTKIAQCSAPGARLATFSVAGFVREGLSRAGFEVRKVPGFGRKRHRLEATFPGTRNKVGSGIRPIIVGVGIGGSSFAHAFLKRGIAPVIIDMDDGTAASGNPAAIVKPRLDLQDRPESRFFLSSYLYACRCYDQIGTVLGEGVSHLSKTPDDAARFHKLLDQGSLPEHHMQAEDTEAVFFPKAQVIDPVKSCEKLRGDLPVLNANVADIEVRADGEIAVLDRDGQCLASGTHVIFAIGAGIRDHPLFSDFALRFSRGQISWAEADIPKTLTYGGYAVPMGRELLLGATHDRLDGRDPYELWAESDNKNLADFHKATGQEALRSNRSSRASVRVNMPDTLPRLIEFSQNVTVLTGLGSRGFVYAPLLAEAGVSQICGEPLPVSKTMWVRFQAREKPNLKAHP